MKSWIGSASLLYLLLFAAILFGCSSPGEDPVDVGSDTLELLEGSGGQRVPASSNRPSWQKINLYDLRTGTSFTLADFEGKVVLLELMTIDCSACDRQAGEIRETLQDLGDEVIAISLALAPDEPRDDVIAHSDEIERTWPISFVGPDFAIAMLEAFGQGIMDPSGSPVLIIGPTGNTKVMPAGVVLSSDLRSEMLKYLP